MDAIPRFRDSEFFSSTAQHFKLVAFHGIVIELLLLFMDVYTFDRARFCYLLASDELFNSHGAIFRSESVMGNLRR